MGVGMLPAGAMAANVLPDDGSGAAEASRPTTYDFIDKHATSDWAITNGGGSDLRIDKQSQTLTFHTDKGWPKADLGTSAAGLEAPKAEWGNIYYEYDFAAVGSARIDLWSGEYLLVLSEAYGKTNSDGVVPGTYHGELSLADMIDKATIYPRQGSGFGAPLTDKSGIDMFHLDGVQVWAVGGDVTIRTLKMTGAPFEQAPQQPTRSLYDALYPTPIFQSHSEAGYSVDVNGNTVIVTNKRIDAADNVGWPSTGGTVDWTIDRNKTPYLYLDVHADDDLGKLSSAKPGWNVILTSKKTRLA